jgi:hypothetical protein
VLKKFYMVLALVLIGGYSFVVLRGLELSPTKKGVTTQGVRGMQSGPRTFWYGGYRGGK